MVPNHARYQLRYASIDILSFNVQVAGYTLVLARRKGNALLGRRSHGGGCSLVSAAKTTGDRCFEKCVLVLMALNHARNLLRYASIDILSFNVQVADRHCLR